MTVLVGGAALGACLLALPGSSLIAFPAVPLQVREIQLTGGDTPLGDGTALVYDGAGGPTPPPQYVDVVDTLYLQPRGFTGTAQSGFLPSQGYPLTGPHSLGGGTSLGLC